MPWSADAYHIVGSFTDWNIEEKPLPDRGARIVVRRDAPRAGSGNARREEFQLVGDRNWDKRIYPAGGEKEEIVLLTPERPYKAELFDSTRGVGHGRNWAVEGLPGSSFRIKYDSHEQVIVCTMST